MRLRRLAKIAVAAAPLIIGSASPAYGCLVLPENQGTQNAADHGAFPCGPVGCGPDAPFDALMAADAKTKARASAATRCVSPGIPTSPEAPTPRP